LEKTSFQSIKCLVLEVDAYKVNVSMCLAAIGKTVVLVVIRDKGIVM